jgi:hypothetical protein
MIQHRPPATVRIVSRFRTLEGAQPVEPTLEDAYLLKIAA